MGAVSNAITEAERAGFDLTLIDANLSYSYEKRVLLHDAALALALEMEKIGRQLRGVRSASVEIELFGRRCRVISVEDLIQAKEALGRDKDLLAAKELRAIREKLRAAPTPGAQKS